MNQATRITALVVAVLTLGVLLWKEQFVLAVIIVVFLLLADQLERLIQVKLKPLGLEMTLSDTLGRDRAKKLEEKINLSIRSFENNSGKKLTEEAMRYVFSVVSEGFLKRKSDLLEKYSINLDDPSQIDTAVEKAVESLETLLEESNSTEKGEVTISNFTKPIKGHYCKVWPFCA